MLIVLRCQKVYWGEDHTFMEKSHGALIFLVASMLTRNKGINHIRNQAGVF